jgi:hypothetical protein
LSSEKLESLRYYAFDPSHLNGGDLRARPLIGRKALLQKSVSTLLGDQVLSRACRLTLEGIVSKRANAPYRSGQTDGWLKSKCIKEQEMVVGGGLSKIRSALPASWHRFHPGRSALSLKALERRTKTSLFASLPGNARRRARFIMPDPVARVNLRMDARWKASASFFPGTAR